MYNQQIQELLSLLRELAVPTVTDVFQAVAACLTALLAAVALWIGWRQLRDYRATSMAQVRPYVLVDFVIVGAFYAIEITNSGRLPATDISFEFHPPVTADAPFSAFLESRMRRGAAITSMAPGRKIQWMVGDLNSALARGSAASEIHVVELKYFGDVGKRNLSPFVERQYLDLGQYAGTAVPRGEVTDLTASIAALTRRIDGTRGAFRQ
ncbi:MAG: hypothetical protein V4479_11740 [Actinomycetota bacterium]